MNHYIAIIPARNNSKRIKHKNIQKLKGKMLINYTIEAAKKLKEISKIVITTDIQQIIKKNSDSKIIYIKRPKRLARDTSSTESAIFHSLDYLKKKKKIIPKNIILLQPTSPLRDKADIFKSIKKYEKGKYDSLFSAYEEKILIWKKENNKFKPINYNIRFRKREQESKKLIIENGAIFIFNHKKFLKHKVRLFDKIGCFLMTKKKSLEIDDKYDLEIGNKI